MAEYRYTLGHLTYRFKDLAEVMAKASPLRSGDQLAGVAAATAEERVVAQMVLAELPLSTFLNETVIPYEQDEVTRLIIDTHDSEAFAPVASLTVGELRNWLLLESTDATVLQDVCLGLTPGDGSRGEQNYAQSGSNPGGQKM